MELITYDFQTRAERSLYERITHSLSTVHDTPTNILFAAPVASGKTKMTAMVINRLASTHPDVAFFFITPSTGGLNENAYEELRQYGLDNVKVQTMMECVVQARDGIEPGTLTVLGWSDIHSSKKNVQMRDGEQQTLRSVLEENDTPIVLFVDEAHSNRTKNTDNVKALIAPSCIVNITATPRASDKSGIADDDRITIEPDEVAAEGKIKSHIIVNDAGDKDVTSINPTWEGIIKSAMRRRDLLDEESVKCGMDITHLMVIQLPNDKKDSDRKDTQETMRNMVRAKQILKDNGADDDDIIVWLAGQHDVEPTEIKNTRHKYLITKLAVSQGWNCPRANPWAKIRSTSESETLDAQTLGRFMRTEDPYAWRTNDTYRNDTMLNSAWVYTAEENYDASLKGYSIRDEKYQIHLKPEYKETVKGIRLVRIRAGEKDHTIDATNKQNVINGIVDYLKDNVTQTQWSSDQATRDIARTDFDVTSMYDDIARFGTSIGQQGKATVAREQARHYLFDIRLKNSPLTKYGDGDIADITNSAIDKCLHDVQSTQADENWFDFDFTDNTTVLSDDGNICLGILANFDGFSSKLVELLDENTGYSDDIIMDGNDGSQSPMYCVPETTFTGVTLTNDVPQNFIYDRMSMLDTKYGNEQMMQDVLQREADWWLKNGTTDMDSFQIAWIDGNQHRKFFPDFIAGIGDYLLIIEVKGPYENGENKVISMSDDKGKSIAIHRWLTEPLIDGRTACQKSIDFSGLNGITFGICRRINGKWCIYVGDGSDYENVYGTNWKSLDETITSIKKGQ